MNYRGFTIIKTCYGQWVVRKDIFCEYLATSKDDAMAQDDELIERANRIRTKQAA